VPASAAAPAKVSTSIVGGNSFTVNRYFKSSMRFRTDVISIRSGGRLTIVNRGPKDEGHTFTIVKSSDVPKTVAGFDKCYAPTGACGRTLAAHQFPEGDGPPKVLLVDGGDGFNKLGDSVVIGPTDSPFKTQTITISAARGTTLRFMCVIHPWMNGKLKVG
jgi:hypothetical protein